jgi:hypothetical protein
MNQLRQDEILIFYESFFYLICLPWVQLYPKLNKALALNKVSENTQTNRKYQTNNLSFIPENLNISKQLPLTVQRISNHI